MVFRVLSHGLVLWSGWALILCIGRITRSRFSSFFLSSEAETGQLHVLINTWSKWCSFLVFFCLFRFQHLPVQLEEMSLMFSSPSLWIFYRFSATRHIVLSNQLNTRTYLYSINILVLICSNILRLIVFILKTKNWRTQTNLLLRDSWKRWALKVEPKIEAGNNIFNFNFSFGAGLIADPVQLSARHTHFPVIRGQKPTAPGFPEMTLE